jgi:outer membrane immunogenic protein
MASHGAGMQFNANNVRRLALGTSVFSLLIGSLLIGANPAFAADIPRLVAKARPLPHVYNWTGLYAGINGGAGFDTSNFANADVKIRTRGALIGGTAGYNFQRGWMVWGIEGDLAWSDASGGVACGAFFCEAKNNWLGTVRGRAGRAFGRWLPYLTAGVATGHVETTSTNPALAGGSETKVGWVAGLGIEHAFTANWSAKLEYLYVCLGRIDLGSVCSTSTMTDNISIKQSVVRLGINTKFNGPLLSR